MRLSLGVEYFGELGTLLRNPSYISACLSLLTIFAGLGILGVVSTYAYVYVYGLTTEELTIAGLAKLPGVLTALPLLALLSRWLDKKQTLILATAVTCVLVALPHMLKMADWFPGNDSPFLLAALFVPLLVGFMIFPVSAITGSIRNATRKYSQSWKPGGMRQPAPLGFDDTGQRAVAESDSS